MTTEKAVLAGGCFWGMQDLIRKLPGVITTRVGYTGGTAANATYRNHQGHAEAIEITFDSDRTSYRDLLEFFFQIHDPTTRNRQGNDIGTSYRSAVFYLTEAQRKTAEDTIADVNASGLWPGKVVTEVSPACRSGRPSLSTRTTWSDTPTGTRATSPGPAGSCRAAPTRSSPRVLTRAAAITGLTKAAARELARATALDGLARRAADAVVRRNGCRSRLARAGSGRPRRRPPPRAEASAAAGRGRPASCRAPTRRLTSRRRGRPWRSGSWRLLGPRVSPFSSARVSGICPVTVDGRAARLGNSYGRASGR